MPHFGLSWARIKEHFRVRAPIYIVGIIICLLMTNLLYTTTAPTPPSNQVVTIYLTDSATDPDPLEEVAADALAYGQTIDETLVEVGFESISYSNSESDYYSVMVLVARLSTGDGDVFFASADAADYLIRAEAFEPLDDYLDAGWMEGLDLEPYYYTSDETGETYIAALSLENVTGLDELNAFTTEGAYLIIAANGTNIDTSMEVTEYIVRTLMEGDYASTESTESAD